MDSPTNTLSSKTVTIVVWNLRMCILFVELAKTSDKVIKYALNVKINRHMFMKNITKWKWCLVTCWAGDLIWFQKDWYNLMRMKRIIWKFTFHNWQKKNLPWKKDLQNFSNHHSTICFKEETSHFAKWNLLVILAMSWRSLKNHFSKIQLWMWTVRVFSNPLI